jgi:hypothetical protein
MQSTKFKILYFIWSERLSGGWSERDRQQIADVHRVQATVAHPSLIELYIQNSINPLSSFTHHNNETKKENHSMITDESVWAASRRKLQGFYLSNKILKMDKILAVVNNDLNVPISRGWTFIEHRLKSDKCKKNSCSRNKLYCVAVLQISSRH